MRRYHEIGLKIEIEAVLRALNSFSSSVHPTGAVLVMRVRPQPVATIDTMCPHGQLRKADATVGIKYDPVGMAVAQGHNDDPTQGHLKTSARARCAS